jgi:hypothetical protein
MSYFVRASKRWASSSLPSPRRLHDLHDPVPRGSTRRRLDALFGHDVVNGRIDEDLLVAISVSPVSGLMASMRVTSSPKNSMR